MRRSRQILALLFFFSGLAAFILLSLTGNWALIRMRELFDGQMPFRIQSVSSGRLSARMDSAADFQSLAAQRGVPPEWRLHAERGTVQWHVWNGLLRCPYSASWVFESFQMMAAAPSGLRPWDLLPALQAKARPSLLQDILCRPTHIDLRAGSLEFLPEGMKVDDLRITRSDSSRLKMQGRGTFYDRPWNLILSYDRRLGAAAVTFDADGAIQADGSFAGEGSDGRFEGEVRVKKYAVAVPAGCGQSGAEGLCLHGPLSADFSAAVDLEALADGRGAEAVKLEGALDWRGGRLEPFNLPFEILSQVARMPGMDGLTRALQEQDLLTPGGPGTPFELLRAVFTLQEGFLHVDDVILKRGDIFAEGEGAYDFSARRLEFRGRLILLPEASAALSQQIPALARMKNEAGRLAFPFRIEGPPDQPVLRAELGALAEGLMQSYRSELVRHAEKRLREAGNV